MILLKSEGILHTESEFGVCYDVLMKGGPGSYLLQVKFWQTPFHLLGGGPKPSSEKDGESGHMPPSSMPMMTSPSKGSSSGGVRGKPKKSHDLVVRSLCVLLGKTDTMPSMPEGKGNK